MSAYRYDAVVLDLSLGESDGIALLQALRDSLSDPVLILISGLDERVRSASARLARALDLRVAGAIQKPVSPAAMPILADGARRPGNNRTHLRAVAADRAGSERRPGATR